MARTPTRGFGHLRRFGFRARNRCATVPFFAVWQSVPVNIIRKSLTQLVSISYKKGSPSALAHKRGLTRAAANEKVAAARAGGQLRDLLFVFELRFDFFVVLFDWIGLELIGVAWQLLVPLLFEIIIEVVVEVVVVKFFKRIGSHQYSPGTYLERLRILD